MEINSLKESVDRLLDRVYPVGSIYMSVSEIEPSVLFGGEWERWGNGRVPIGVDTNDTDFTTSEKIGGSKAVTLTTNQIPSHNHVYSSVSTTTGSTVLTTNQIPAHNHYVVHKSTDGTIDITTGMKYSMARYSTKSDYPYALRAINDSADSLVTSTIGGSKGHTHSITLVAANTNETGDNRAHINLQPYITCFMWKRIA